jgi:hypothetical protein
MTFSPSSCHNPKYEKKFFPAFHLICGGDPFFCLGITQTNRKAEPASGNELL